MIDYSRIKTENFSPSMIQDDNSTSELDLRKTLPKRLRKLLYIGFSIFSAIFLFGTLVFGFYLVYIARGG